MPCWNNWDLLDCKLIKNSTIEPVSTYSRFVKVASDSILLSLVISAGKDSLYVGTLSFTGFGFWELNCSLKN